MADIGTGTDPEALRRSARAYVEKLGGDRAGWLGLFGPDARLADPAGTEAHVGTDGVARFFDQLSGMADEVHAAVRSTHICGREAAVAYTVGLSSPGRRVTIEAVAVIAFGGDGRIREVAGYWDPANVTTEVEPDS